MTTSSRSIKFFDPVGMLINISKHALGIPVLAKKQIPPYQTGPAWPDYSMDTGLIPVTFSKTDELGIIQPMVLKKQKQKKEEKLTEAKPTSSKSKTKKSAPKAFGNLDCHSLYQTFRIIGIRNGNIHLFANDAVGKAHKIVVKDVFDVHGKLKVCGLRVRYAVGKLHNGKTIYEKVGIIDLLGNGSLSARNFMLLEDVINHGMENLRNMPSTREHFEKMDMLTALQSNLESTGNTAY